jgi:hypothetical protein
MPRSKILTYDERIGIEMIPDDFFNFTENRPGFESIFCSAIESSRHSVKGKN